MLIGLEDIQEVDEFDTEKNTLQIEMKEVEHKNSKKKLKNDTKDFIGNSKDPLNEKLLDN